MPAPPAAPAGGASKPSAVAWPAAGISFCACSNAAIRLAAQTEGLILDPVYTAKAMAGLIDLLAKGRFADARDVVFLHTGGSPALFAYEGAPR